MLKELLLPPASCALTGLVGLACVALRRRRLGWSLVALAWGACLALSLPHVSTRLMGTLQTYPAVDPRVTRIDAQVVVVLAADVDADLAEYGQDEPGPLSLVRCRYGAALARRTGLPLCISGGVLRPGRPAVSVRLAAFVERELGVDVRWREERSTSTLENARCTAELLRAEGVTRVALVTHAWHMPRAARAFERAGLTVLAAPTAAVALPERSSAGWTPRAKALQQSSWALHEWLGRAWYAVRARVGRG